MISNNITALLILYDSLYSGVPIKATVAAYVLQVHYFMSL